MGNSINNIKFLGRKFFGVRNLNTVVVYDVDAQNYFNSNTAITSAADKNAINDFYVGLKTDGIYTKIKAMYLPIWGSAANSKWNLINPLDTNAAFRLTFTTGWTFSSGGMTPNGTSAYANTFLIPSTALTTMSQHISYYSRTNNTTAAIRDNGCQDDVAPSIGRNIYAQYYNTSTLSRIQIQALDVNATTFTEANSLGFILGSRTSATSLKAYRNNILKSTNTTNSTSGLCGNSVYIGGFNYRNNLGSTNFYGIRQCAFASIGNGLTDTEASNFYTRVNTLMTYFGINV
jgi:hypothetical protein